MAQQRATPLTVSPDEELQQLKNRVALLERRLQKETERNVIDLPSHHTWLAHSADSLPKVVADTSLTIVIVGASGDLAKKKTLPSLFQLHMHGLLPPNTRIVGYARTKMTDEEFHKNIVSIQFPKMDPQRVAQYKDSFLALCTYVSGNYDSSADMAALNTHLNRLEAGAAGNRIFYLAVPPSVFIAASRAIHDEAQAESGWTRLIVEKPFGRDLASSHVLNHALAALYREEQLYRIDHYLGKELVQNLMVLRFGNTAFEPLFNNQYVANVQITFKEPFGTEGRGGYFDEYGIVRDVAQNHLLQILALLTMESPVTMGAEDIRDEKVKVLRYVETPRLEDVVVGQYVGDKAGKFKGYKQDPGVPADSITPTFAMVVLRLTSQRWHGVPFVLKCGKALNERKAEIRIQFKPSLLFPQAPPNELVIRVQPDEAMWLKVTTKQPGLSNDTKQVDLNITYKDRFELKTDLPDAYERLIHDVIRGDHSLFVREDELDVAWRIFTPLLHELEAKRVQPIPYEYGTRGPAEADELLKQIGFRRNAAYTWTNPKL